MPTRMNSRVRAGIALLLFLFCLLALDVRLAWLQLVRGQELGNKALNQWMREIPVEPKRGIIYDRNGNELAISASADTVVAIPAQIKDAQATATQLASILSMSESKVYEAITRKKAAVYIARKVDSAIATQIRALALPGITFTEESRRFYPYGNLASQLLGFAGVDSQGLYGLELKYDQYLRGEAGYLQYPTDNKGQEIPDGTPTYVPPEDGNDLKLTVDEVIQHIIERELDNAMALHNAEGALGIVMDPNTGAILAMANRPDFDPNDYMAAVEASGSTNVWLNEAISGGFEPGSTFKVVTASAGLELGVVTEDTEYYCKGYEIVADRRLHCWKRTGHGEETFREVIYNSCNPGFISVGIKIGAERLMQYISQFGFGKKTGIDLPGEAIGVMFGQVGPVELATMSFGQGPSVTPIQQVVAMAAIANGGKTLRPYVVDQVVDQEGNVVLQNETTVVGQAVTEETAARMRELLEGVVSEGGGRNAYIPGYRLAGKTGTAQVPKPGGGYYSNKYISSFIGFAPADDPQVVIFLAIKDPKGEYGYYGANTAAPSVRNVAQDILYYLDVRPQVDASTAPQVDPVVVPALVDLTSDQALTRLQDTGLNIRLDGQGQKILDQTPKAGVKVAPGSTVIVYLGQQAAELGQPVQVPHVVGLSLRDASVKLSALGLQIQAVGSGVASSQSPVTGTTIPAGSIVTVNFVP